MSNVIPEKMVHLESWSANLLQVLNGSIGTPNVLSVRSQPVNIGEFHRHLPQFAGR